jgi:Secretion system C-terminal sorting domain
VNRKILLGLLALAAAHSAAEAQSRRSATNPNGRRIYQMSTRAVTTDAPASATTPATGRRVQAPSPASWGELIGSTTYDLQTNSSTGNRMAMSNGALSAVWTQSCNLNSAPNFNNRGVGYNYAASANGGTTPSFLNGSTGNCGTGFGNFGISNVRVGWPEVIQANNNEVVVAHTATLGLTKIVRPIGSGNWTQSALTFTQNIDGPGRPAANGFWPRMVASGNTVHLIYCDNPLTTVTTNPPTQAPIAQPSGTAQPTGVVAPLLYARSLDGGVTWDKSNIVLPMFDNAGLGTGAVLPSGAANDTVNLGGDSYVVAVNGNNVAVCVTDLGRNAVLAKSTDGGTTWSSRLIMGNYTDNDTIGVRTTSGRTTSVLSSDGSMSMVIDNGGTVHWFSGTCLVPVRKRAGSPYWGGFRRFFQNSSDTLLYWNDRELAGSRPVAIDTLDTSCPANGSFTPCALATGDAAYQTAGILTMPTATVDAATGDVYVIYAGGRVAVSNDGTVDGQFLRDLYLKKLSFTGGQIQSYVAKNISRDIKNIADGAAAQAGEESVFPSAVHTLENNFIHYQWMSDFEPGTALQGDPVDTEVENAIMYDRIDVTTVNWGTPAIVTGMAEDLAANVASAFAAPNPTTGVTTLALNLKQAANAMVIVRNTLGQEVLRVPANNLHTGLNTIHLDLSGKAAGVYFYTVAADKFTFTKRVVKN